MVKPSIKFIVKGVILTSDTETVAIVRSLSMVGRVPVRVSQLASLFMPYPAFSAMPTKRKSLAMVGLRSFEYILPSISLTGSGKAPTFMATYTDERVGEKKKLVLVIFRQLFQS